MQMRAYRHMQTAVAFLGTMFKYPYRDGWNKIKSMGV